MGRNVFGRVFTLAFLTWIGLAGNALSQTQEEYTDIYTLGEVVVTGERLIVESVGTTREVTARDIENKGARTLDEALDLLPGVIIRTGADGVPRVDLRGFRSRHIILLLDGIPLNSAADGQFDPALIPVESIAEIKVSYGSHSLLYGDGGLAGVINIITKSGKKGIHGMASGEAGEGDERLGRFSLSGGRENLNLFVSGSVFDRDAFPLSDDFESTSEESGDHRENSDFDRNNLFANVGFSPNDEWEIGLVLNYLEGEFGIPPSVINDRNDPFANRPRFERVDDFKGFSGHVAVSYYPSGPLNIRSWLFINQLEQERNRYDDSDYDSMETAGTFSSDDTTLIYGAALQTTYDLESLGAVTLGLNARREEFETDGSRRVSAGRGATTLEFFDEEDDQEIYSAVIDYEISPLDGLGLVFEYAHNWLEGKDDESAFLIGSHYDIFKDTRIRGSIARQIRFPSLTQLYDQDAGNPDLTTEKSYNFELGIDQALPWKSKVSLTGFIEEVKDYIEKIPPTDTFQNNDKYRFEGFELTAENRFLENLMLRAGYTFLHTEDKSPGTEKDELQYRPRHKVTLEGRYWFDFGLSLYGSLLYVADQVFYSRTAPLLKKELNDYLVVSVKADQTLFNGLLRLYIGADNIFDQNYEESYGFPQPGRFVYAGGEYRF